MVRRSTRRDCRLPVVMTALVWIAGCQSDEAWSRDTGAIDADAVPALMLVEDRRIGSLDDPNYGFSSVGGVEVDEGGNLYVLETRDREIRVYSASGELIRRMGRSGSGPGEFETSPWYFGMSGDTLWALADRRINLFDREGRVLSSAEAQRLTAPLHAEGSTTDIVPAALGPDHLFISDRGTTGYAGIGTGETMDTAFIPRVRFSASGQIVDTVEVYAVPRSHTQLVDVGRSQFPLPAPPSGVTRVNIATGSLRIEAGDIEEFRVERFDHSGESIRSRTFRYSPRAFPDSVLDAAAARSSRSGAANISGTMIMATSAGVLRLEQHAADTAAARRLIRAQMNWPQHQPPVLAARFGADRAVWLRRETAEGAETFRWLILDEDLMPVGELEVPSRLRIVWSSGDRLWAVENDDFGVPWLVDYRIQTP